MTRAKSRMVSKRSRSVHDLKHFPSVNRHVSCVICYLSSVIFHARCFTLLACALLAGCAEQEMAQQPKYQRPYQESTFFEDGQSSRPLVFGTVARGQLWTDRAYAEGMSGDLLIDEIPTKVDRAVLARGQERFTIYCSPCHGRTGDGQ